MYTERVQFEAEPGHLSGWLDLPEAAGPYPAIVLVHGSGPTDLERENRYVPIREAFTQAGLACLMWDKPGCGSSDGVLRQIQSCHSRASEVVAAIEMLKGRPDIYRDRIGLWGISEGVWVSALVRRKGVEVPFMILVSGPSSTLAYAAEYIARTNLLLEGLSQVEVDSYLQAIRACFRLWRSGAPYESFLEAREPLRASSFFQMTGWTKLERPDWEDPGSRENLDIDTQKLLSSITCPVLAAFGEKDSQVDWRKSMAVHREALAGADNSEVTVLSFADANHNLRRCVTGSVRETRKGGQGAYVEGYVEAMVDWLTKRGFAGTGYPDRAMT